MVVMLTSGVPVGSSSISQCLHPRYKGLHRRNLQVHSFCPDYSVHSRAREEEIRGEDTHTHTETRTVKWGTLGQRHVLSDTPEHGSGPVRTALEAISTEDRVRSQWRWPPVPALSRKFQELSLSIWQALVQKGL